MKVLVACEFSGVVRDAFIARGHEAYSVDLCACWESPNSSKHFKADVRPFLRLQWDLVIAHPPCTYLCRAGSHLLVNNPARYQRMEAAARFFRECFNANAPRVCVENPVIIDAAIGIIGRRYTQLISPSQFGHAIKKRTCLWLKGLPKLRPTNVVEDVANSDVWRNRWSSNHRQRRQERSVTFKGIAEAMAEQWGGLA